MKVRLPRPAPSRNVIDFLAVLNKRRRAAALSGETARILHPRHDEIPESVMIDLYSQVVDIYEGPNGWIGRDRDGNPYAIKIAEAAPESHFISFEAMRLVEDHALDEIEWLESDEDL